MQGNSHGLLIRGSCVQVAYGSLPENHASSGSFIRKTPELPVSSISPTSLGHTFGHRRPKALDLYCGAGGVATGLYRAGFDVVGVDIEPQPRYPFEFHQADALEFPVDGYDFIWASPPCQRYSAGAAKWGTQANHPDLIAPTRLRISGYPYVIENIQPALRHLRAPILLCGQMFGLGVFRHRLFESSLALLAPPHLIHDGKVGDGKYHTVTGHAGGSSKRDGWKGGTTADWKVAMGIDWMTGKELAEAIPPMFSEFIGRQVLTALERRHD